MIRKVSQSVSLESTETECARLREENARLRQLLAEHNIPVPTAEPPMRPCAKPIEVLSPEERRKRARKRIALLRSLFRGITRVLRQEEVHVVANTIAEGMTDFPNTAESRDQAITAGGGEGVGRLEGLFEHAHQRVEISFVLIADITTEPGGVLAVENHQLGESFGIPDGLFVMGDGLLGLRDGRVLVSKGVG